MTRLIENFMHVLLLAPFIFFPIQFLRAYDLWIWFVKAWNVLINRPFYIVQTKLIYYLILLTLLVLFSQLSFQVFFASTNRNSILSAFPWILTTNIKTFFSNSTGTTLNIFVDYVDFLRTFFIGKYLGLNKFYTSLFKHLGINPKILK